MGLVYGPQTPVGVVVGTGAGTEGAHWKIMQRRFWSDTRLKAETCAARVTHGPTCPVGRGVPVLVVVSEAGESRHGTGVVVSDPLDHLPHLLPPLLFFLKPHLLVASPIFPEQTGFKRYLTSSDNSPSRVCFGSLLISFKASYSFDFASHDRLN